jgi:hypothetical protein
MKNTEMKEYKGMECVFVQGDETINCYVVNVDRTLGITIYNDDDEEFYCLNKKDVFLQSLKYRKDRERIYHKVFSTILVMINKGTIEEIEIGGDLQKGFRIGRSNFYSNSLSCAFK